MTEGIAVSFFARGRRRNLTHLGFLILSAGRRFYVGAASRVLGFKSFGLTASLELD